MIYYAKIDGEDMRVEADRQGSLYVVKVGGKTFRVDCRHLDDVGAMSMIINHRCYEASVVSSDKPILVCIGGEKFEVDIEDELSHLAASPSSHHVQTDIEEVRAPMPGVVVSIEVIVGQEVGSGAAVALVEAMKMQNEIATVGGGKVAQILVREGDVVESRQPLVILERTS